MENMKRLFHKRNVFNLSHERKLSCDMGKLIPIMCEEVLPGDTFKVKSDLLVRIAPLLAPTMHRLNAYIHYFYVPNRLLWNYSTADSWEGFITGGVDGNNSAIAPYHTWATTPGAGTLADHLGVPINASNVTHSMLPFRAYAMIYNEWYRDQNLQTKVPIQMSGGEDSGTSIDLLSRNWEKDYFTSALPWAQRGNAVTLPIAGNLPVTIPGDSTSQQLRTGWYDSGGTWHDTGIGSTGGLDVLTTADPGSETPYIHTKGQSITDRSLHGTADASSATAITINDLRSAFQIQKWMERNARGGVRYIESILAHFGVLSSDARLQRPEFLGGGQSQVVISEVLQTSKTDSSGTPLGTMAGHAFSTQRSNQFKKSFEEHGYVIGILSIMPRTAYQQGLSRSLSRTSRYHYYWPEFANLGEQAVLRKEVYCGSDGLNDSVFGYQGRYDEYRRRESTVHGDFKTTLDYWHMGRIFDSPPLLNSSFITCTPTKRINAVTSGNNCWVQVLNNVKAIRPLPKTGEPGLIDHN